MLHPLSFNDWLEAHMDEIPEDVDLYEAYDSYCKSVEELNLDSQLASL